MQCRVEAKKNSKNQKRRGGGGDFRRALTGRPGSATRCWVTGVLFRIVELGCKRGRPGRAQGIGDLDDRRMLPGLKGGGQGPGGGKRVEGGPYPTTFVVCNRKKGKTDRLGELVSTGILVGVNGNVGRIEGKPLGGRPLRLVVLGWGRYNLTQTGALSNTPETQKREKMPLIIVPNYTLLTSCAKKWWLILDKGKGKRRVIRGTCLGGVGGCVLGGGGGGGGS